MYYFVHDLPEVKFVNRNVLIPNTILEREVSCFLLQDDMHPLFTLNDSRYIVITAEMKAAMIKEKLTNIDFKPVYGVSSMEEYYELQRDGKLRYPTHP